MYRKDDGVSPVIGVVLLVAVTVALVASAAFVSFDAIDNVVREDPDAEVSLSYEKNSGPSRIGYLSAELVRNQNVETIQIETPDGNTGTMSEVGDTVNLTVQSSGTAYARALDNQFDAVLTQIEIQNN